MKDFKNKVVVITGAGSGIGRALACAFASQGAKLALNDFNAAALSETIALLQG
jgi:NAD(P)-dependent dehydrogenase (short-subunit alcohol dehydrogenase family)